MSQPVSPQPEQTAYAPPPEYREPVSRVNLVAVGTALVAAVLGVLAITVLDWFRLTYGGFSGDTQSTFGKIRDALSGAHDGNGNTYGISPTYFSWLGYAALAVAVVGAIACAVRPLGALRVLCAVVSVAGLVLTLWAIDLYHFAPQARRYTDYAGGIPSTGYFDWLKRTGVGTWAMLAAFLLCLVTTLLRPRRQRSRGY